MTNRAMHPTIRRVTTPDEWRVAEALLHEYVEEFRSASRREPSLEQPDLRAELSRLRRTYGGPFGGLFVAWSGDEALGIVALSCHRDSTAELKRLFVRPRARRAGTADRLVYHAIRRAAAHGCSEIWLESIRNVMDPAIRLYERNGFGPHPTRTRTVELDDVVVMSRPLARLQPRPTFERRVSNDPTARVSHRSSLRPAR